MNQISDGCPFCEGQVFVLVPDGPGFSICLSCGSMRIDSRVIPWFSFPSRCYQLVDLYVNGVYAGKSYTVLKFDDIRTYFCTFIPMENIGDLHQALDKIKAKGRPPHLQKFDELDYLN